MMPSGERAVWCSTALFSASLANLTSVSVSHTPAGFLTVEIHSDLHSNYFIWPFFFFKKLKRKYWHALLLLSSFHSFKYYRCKRPTFQFSSHKFRCNTHSVSLPYEQLLSYTVPVKSPVSCVGPNWSCLVFFDVFGFSSLLWLESHQ